MTKLNFKATGDLVRQNNGCADFLAEGYIMRGEEKIPCKIGYTEWLDDNDVLHLDPDYIFIEDGITENGTHYEAETICIL